MISYIDVKNYAISENDKLTNDNFTNQVHWIHNDGSSGCWNSAFVECWQDWYIIYTEYHGYFIYHETDLIELSQVDVESRNVANLIELPDRNFNDEDDNEVMYTNEDYLTWLKESEGYKGTILE